MIPILRKIIRYGLYLFVFLIPLQARYIATQGSIGGFAWEYGTFSIFVTEILLVVLIFFGFVLHLMDYDEELHFRNRRSRTLYLMLGALALLGVASVLWAEDIRLAAIGALRLTEGIAIVYLLGHSSFSLHRMAQVFVVSGVVQSVIGLWQFLGQYWPASTLLGTSLKMPSIQGLAIIETEGERFLRAYGTFSHPNILAAFLVIALVFALILIFTHRSNIERMLMFGAGAVLSAGLLVTFSRMGAVVLIIALAVVLVYLLANKNRGLTRQFLQYLGVVVASAAVLAVIFSPITFFRYFAPENLTSAAVTERVEMTGMARQIIEARWHRGVGVNNYTVILQMADPTLEGYEYQPVHNVYLLVFSELGLIGIILFIVILYSIVRHILNFRVEYSQEMMEMMEKFKSKDLFIKDYAYSTHWYIGFSGLVLGFLAWFFFDHFFWTLYPGILMWWLVVGLWIRQFTRVKS